MCFKDSLSCWKSDNNSTKMILSSHMLFYCPSQMSAARGRAEDCWHLHRANKNHVIIILYNMCQLAPSRHATLTRCWLDGLMSCHRLQRQPVTKSELGERLVSVVHHNTEPVSEPVHHNTGDLNSTFPWTIGGSCRLSFNASLIYKIYTFV